MCEDARSKLVAMLDCAETEAEREFWARVMDILEHLCRGEVVKVVRDDGAVLMVRVVDNNAQVVDGAEGKVGFLDPASASTVIGLWLRDGGRLEEATSEEFARFRLEVMAGR